jgi:hypothetical protein
VALALAVLLAADARAVAHLRSEHRCAGGPLSRSAGVDATISLAPGLRPGDDVVGSALLSNLGSRVLRVRDVAAVLVEPSGATPLTWAGGDRPQRVDLAPRSVAKVDVVLHTSRCRGQASRLRPGFYEVTLVVRTDTGDLRAGLRAVVVAAR